MNVEGKPPKNSQTLIHTDPKLGMDEPTPTLISSTSLAKVLVTTFTQKMLNFCTKDSDLPKDGMFLMSKT
jgi:hypothetical protein